MRAGARAGGRTSRCTTCTSRLALRLKTRRAVPNLRPSEDDAMAMALEWNAARLRKEAALIPPRAALGASMVYHGLGKLRGGAPEQVGGWFESIGLRPGKPLAVATGIAEVF